MKGQGAINNVKNRFSKTEVLSFWEEEWLEDFEKEVIKTEIKPIYPKTIVNPVNSSDLPFIWSLNPYQGCEHGCSYCYARPTHEYWSLNAGVDFERKILFKTNASELLENFFHKKNHIVSPISISGNTDAYQPVEKKLEITRSILKTMLRYKHPVTIITKNALVLRDLDILIELNKENLVGVAISITTLDEDLRRKLEPRTSTSINRLKTIQTLSNNGIPVFGMIAPIIPGLTNHELLSIASNLKKHGAKGMSYSLVRLNDTVEPIFTEWIQNHFPDKAPKVLNHIKSVHQGNLGSKIFKERMKGSGKIAESIHSMANIAKLKYFPDFQMPKLNTSSFISNGQFKLF